jgi:hypothetical protein
MTAKHHAADHSALGDYQQARELDHDTERGRRCRPAVIG